MRTRDEHFSELRPTSDATAVRLPHYVYGLSTALALVALSAGSSTFAIRGVLHGTALMNGSARGTALIMFAVAVPCLLASMWLAAKGSARAVFVWFGTTMYLAYNAVLLSSPT